MTVAASSEPSLESESYEELEELELEELEPEDELDDDEPCRALSPARSSFPATAERELQTRTKIRSKGHAKR